MLTAERHYAEISASTRALAGLAGGAGLTRPVPTCPDPAAADYPRRPGDGEPDPRAAGLAEGESRHVHAADVPDGTGEWLVSHDPAGITVRRVYEKGALALRGGSSDLLVLLRRLPADDPAVARHGHPAVLRRWLDQTRF